MSSDRGSVSIDGDRAAVVFERTLEASVARVWQALTDPDDLAAWLESASIGRRVGGDVHIGFDNGPVTGVVTEWEPPTLLEYTWIIEGEPESVVRFELSDVGGATRLVLEHVRLPESMGPGYGAGWHGYLDRLDDRLAGRGVRDWAERFDEVFDGYRLEARP